MLFEFKCFPEHSIIIYLLPSKHIIFHTRAKEVIKLLLVSCPSTCKKVEGMMIIF